jgi:DNA primase catalytic core
MPRIPESEIERIKRDVDLVALVQSKGIELKKHGSKDLAGLSPFTKEKTPSFIVTPGKNLWHCMSSGKGGSVIDFVMTYEGVSFRHAYEMLAQGNVTTLLRANRPLKCSLTRKLPAPVEFDADDRTLMRQVIDYYRQRLQQTPMALDYLLKRGLTAEAVEHFQIGYADRTLGLTLPVAATKAGGDIRERLKKIGLLRAETGHEHFNGCVVFPITDEAGNITEVYGRKVYNNLRPGTCYHLYLPGPHAGIFNGAALKQSRQIILCEAIIDAATFWSAGHRNVTCIYGTEGFTDELWKAFDTHQTERVYLAYDRDAAGDRAAERDTARFLAKGIEVYRINFPMGMDANEYARKVTPPEKSLSLLINAAAWCGHGKAPVVKPEPPREKEPWEKVPADIAAPLAKELGQELKGVAMDIDEDGEHLPTISNVSLKTGQGWTQEPYWPAPFAEVETQQNQLRQMAEERGLLPVSPAPASSSSLLAATVSCSEEATKKERVAPAPVPSGLEQRGEAWFLVIENREYRVTGLEKTVGGDGLKIGLRVQTGDRFHLDQVDLIRDGERRRFIERASEETGLTAELLKRDMGRVLLAVEQAHIQLLKPGETIPTAVTLSAEEREEALRWLREPNLMERLKEAFHLAGIIGEETNTLVAYLAGVSRKLERPLAIIIQSASAAGKSTLMDAVLSFFPEEERVKYSAMTGQSLYYLGETNLQHKILAVVEEAGAEKASYALKLLQSEGELTIASTGKDPNTGRMVTQEYHVEGPVMIFLTTTAINMDEELQNRCLTLAVDESPAQTDRIHRLQRERRTLAGLIAKEERKDVLTKLKNAQRLLAPIHVLNPYAPGLTFPSGRTRNRRDHEKYLTLIEAIALLHQHQRPRGQQVVRGRVLEYICVTLDDIALANQLAPEVLGRSLDELPPQTRRLLETIREIVTTKKKTESAKTATCFSRREVRDLCGWSLTQVRVHLERLVELEYLAIRCGRMGGPFQYELLIEVDAPENVAHIGFIDVEELRKTHTYDAGVAGQNGQVAGGGKTAPPPSSGYREAA